jgi:molybdate transport system substrate-binding protein
MNRRHLISSIGLSTLSVLLPSWAMAQPAKTKLMIYCGVTMAKAVGEVADQFKLLHPEVEIVMLRGGSKDLYENIVSSNLGDLYLPGEPSYIHDNQGSGLFAQSVEIGYNQIALMVQKGNPKGVKPDMRELLRKDLVTILSSPDQGSVGLETKHVLTQQGFYDEAIAHASALMSDGRSLTQAIKKGEGDVCLNWRASLHFAPEDVEIIDLPDAVAPRGELLLTKLTISKQQALADRFITFAKGEVGAKIMHRYGFLGAL